MTWALPAAVSPTYLVRFDNNKYSVTASAVDRPVEVLAYTERVEVRQDGRVVGEHARAFGRGQGVHSADVILNTLARQRESIATGDDLRVRVAC